MFRREHTVRTTSFCFTSALLIINHHTQSFCVICGFIPVVPETAEVESLRDKRFRHLTPHTQIKLIMLMHSTQMQKKCWFSSFSFSVDCVWPSAVSDRLWYENSRSHTNFSEVWQCCYDIMRTACPWKHHYLLSWFSCNDSAVCVWEMLNE